jgi:hypothetical protein
MEGSDTGAAAGCRRPVTYVEASATRAERAREVHGEDIDTVMALEAVPFTEQFDLAYVDILHDQSETFVRRTSTAFATLLAPGGRCLVTAPSDASALFDMTPFRVIEMLPSVRYPHDATLSSYVLEPAPVRELPEGTLSFSDAIGALDQLRRDVVFQSPDEYIANRQAGLTSVDGKALHFIKHDIHHDLLSCLRFARAEAEIGVRATYFAMPPHDLTAKYIERPDFVDALKEIQSLGHDIGVHVDTLEAAEKGFVEHLMPFIVRLRDAGIRVSHGNTHGNTRFKGHPWFNGQLVFRENLGDQRRKSTGAAIEALAGTVSLAEVAEQLGLVGWWDSHARHRGERLAIDTYWVGDNNGRWTAYLQRTEDGVAKVIDEGGTGSVILDNPGRIADNTCIYLIHPQFYR